MKLEIVENQLKFNIVNSCSPTVQNNNDYTGGIGLTNLRKRLELLYKQKHQLNINHSETKFEAELLITLEKE